MPAMCAFALTNRGGIVERRCDGCVATDLNRHLVKIGEKLAIAPRAI